MPSSTSSGRHAPRAAASRARHGSHRRRRSAAARALGAAAGMAGGAPGVVGLVAVSGAVAGALTGSSSSALAAAGPQRPAVLVGDLAPGGEAELAAERDTAAARASRGARSYLPLNGDPIAAPAPTPVATTPVATTTPAPLPEPAVAPPPPPPVDLLANGFPRVPGCTAEVVTDASNGLLEDADLCPIGDGHQLRPDAAAAYLALDAAFQAAFGTPLQLTDSYRSLAAQRSLARSKPSLAARPGTSEHGWGLAVDLNGGVESYRSAEHQWLREHAPAFGWDNPPWARDGGSREEPWHWEYDPAFVRTA